VTGADYVLVAGWWLGYAAFAALAVWGVLRFTRDAASWQRRGLASLVLAIFFAPSVVGGGHGGGIGPAWMALFQMFPIKLGLLPIVSTFLILFGLASVIAWAKGTKAAE
jgi:hypothetical protein